jgi:hypothetical protein
MNFETLLSTFPDKETAVLIAKEIANEPKRMQDLWDFAISTHEKSWRASWLMDKVYDEAPQLIIPYIPLMIQMIPELECESKQRQFLKLISIEPLPKAISGHFINRCFDLLISNATPVAVRVHAMQILFNFSQQEPDIKNELALIIREHMDEGTAGFRSRGKRILKQLQA